VDHDRSRSVDEIEAPQREEGEERRGGVAAGIGDEIGAGERAEGEFTETVGRALEKTGRPVRLVYTRSESLFANTKRHPFVIRYKTGATSDGRLTAVEASLYGDTGPYASLGTYVVKKAGIHATGPYFVPNVKVDTYTVYTNNLIAGAMRPTSGSTSVPPRRARSSRSRWANARSWEVSDSLRSRARTRRLPCAS